MDLLPPAFIMPGTCVGLTLDGVPGIFLRYGYWLNLNTRQWELKSPPPHYPLDRLPNNMFKFRGKPTMFGSLECDSDATCDATEIVQYQPATDEWIHIGSMSEHKTFLDVAEVPGSVCQHFPAPSTSTETPVTTADPGPTTTPDPSVAKKAALIVGGGLGSSSIDSIELFGCPNSASSLSMGKLPQPRIYSGMTYLEKEGHVLLCGGSICPDGTLSSCNLDNSCFRFYPETGSFIYDSDMTTDRANFVLTQVPEEGTTEPLKPITIAGTATSDIYDSPTKTWSPYKNTPATGNWGHTTHCLINYNGYIFAMDQNLVRLDPVTWSVETLLEDIPQAIGTGRCAGVEIGGSPGIFTRWGFWLNLDTLEWEEKALAPFSPIAANNLVEMWSFQGKPTFFGFPKCDNLGECLPQDVMQYQPDTDTWLNLGPMMEARTMHEVVEVPLEYCYSNR